MPSSNQRAQSGTGFAVDAIARLAREHGAIDLSLGAPDYSPPKEVIEAALAAVSAGHFGYPDPWGTTALRRAIADSLRRHYSLEFDPAAEITVTCGATEALFLALAATLSPGDEVICFDPGYEGFAPAIVAAAGVPRFVRLNRPSLSPLDKESKRPWLFDSAELMGACNSRTRAVLLNSPHNPTGKVFSPAEMQLVAELCKERGLFCICDEVYEHLVFDGRRHVPMMSIDGMRERTFLVNSLSKTFAVPGWRLGYVAASPPLTSIMRGLNDVVAGGVAAPLQEAALAALRMPDSFFAELKRDTERRRGELGQALAGIGMICYLPDGAWYILADFRPLGWMDSDLEFIHHLVCDIGIAAAPGSAYFATPEQDLIRFCFGKSDVLLAGAIERLKKLGGQ